jgi:Flp pilus assembly protein TadD
MAMLSFTSLTLLGGTLETNPEANRKDPDFIAGKKALEQRDWNLAISHFKAANKRLENADLHSHLGYAFRKSSDLDSAFNHYRVALDIDPNHRGTHEYIGEAYITAGKPEKAREHLAKLEAICGKDCEEYQDLLRALSSSPKEKYLPGR